jgi:hypothetical protein
MYILIENVEESQRDKLTQACRCTVEDPNHLLSTFYVQVYYSPCSTCDNESQYDTKVSCDLPLTSNVIYEAVYMVNLDICLPTFEFNDVINLK